MKPCVKCGSTDRRKKDGRCRPCYRAYYQANKQKINSRSLARYYANPQHAIELNRKWKSENPDKVKASSRKRYPKIRQYQNEWQKQNPDKVREYQQRYCEKNAPARRERTRRWKEANPEQAKAQTSRRRARKLSCEGSHTAAEWKAILKKHGNKCATCKERGPLEKDHIIPLSRGGTDFAYNLQPLCRACNIAKYNRIESGAQHSLFDK